MSANLSLRVVDGDAERRAVVELARRIWFEHYPGIISFAQIHYMLERGYRPDIIANEQRDGIEWHTASIDDVSIGFIAFGPWGRETKIHKVYVLERARRTGAGRALMDIAHAAAARNGADALVLSVNKNNLGSVRAYLALGFSFAARVRMPIGHGFVMDDYVMRLPLASGKEGVIKA